MPFKSKAQQRYLEAKKPKVAKEFEASMSKDDYAKLPEKFSKGKPMPSRKQKAKGN